ncbi:uncharacterized protein L969DRAFT_47755 [Mixia osmundae IAM 14324]|uniref:PWI domain-containing protein n=1 Tax=Mixia osmundae (strain CBS 9802 / IAM 14324 / JCM 22182 / KY 12970) TaxID=764103 RepID=G7E9A3_MIXOS|nr:uncharacterized protein L969DRAFT_47755 [Mixia osmundae IAM 14324]KEI39847.1 hypothetical protein L969DRAFT_47755 [Mixia osmundae IAM 14324]GAA99222.1 hypothetical protein E5Q_05915 [Mixia osmundae IAM 14324]
MDSMRGTTFEQDIRFADKDKQLLKTMKFPAEFAQRVDMRKVEMSVMRPWIARRVTELLGMEDEVVIEYVNGLLEDKAAPLVDPKKMQISLTGFLERKTAPFMIELWNLLLSAQASPVKVPAQFIEEKKREMLQRKTQSDQDASQRVANGAQPGPTGPRDAPPRRQLDEIRAREMADRQAQRNFQGSDRGFYGRGRGRGGFQPPPGRDSGYGSRGPPPRMPSPPPPPRRDNRPRYYEPPSRDTDRRPRSRSRTPLRRGRDSRSPVRSLSPRPRQRRRRDSYSPSPPPSPARRRVGSYSPSPPPRSSRRPDSRSLSPSPRGRRRADSYSPAPPPRERRRADSYSPSPPPRSPSPRRSQRDLSEERRPRREASLDRRGSRRARSPSSQYETGHDSLARRSTRRRADSPPRRRRYDSRSPPPRERAAERSRRRPSYSRSPSPRSSRARSGSVHSASPPRAENSSTREPLLNNASETRPKQISIKGSAKAVEPIVRPSMSPETTPAERELRLKEDLLKQKLTRSKSATPGKPAPL